MVLTSIPGWASRDTGPGRHAACGWPLEPTAQRKEGLEIKVGAWWLSLTAAGLVGQRMRRLELMTCHQCELPRHEQEGQGSTPSMKGLEGSCH